MRVLTDDIIQFVHSRFSPRDIDTVYATLADADIGTPRLMRAVLFLSEGSVTQLRHYVEMAMRDFRQVLTWAEYVVDVSPEPLWARDMSQPFPHPRNLGAF
jgi:nicotinamide mononucleotide adenylyltransferase